MKRHFRELSVAAALVVLLLALALFGPAFFQPQPLLSLLTREAPTLVVACGMAVSLPLGVTGIVAVRDPCGGFAGVRRAHAVLRLHILLAAIGLEVDADQRVRIRQPAQFDELAGAHLVRFDSAPQQVQHRRARGARPDAFPPPVVIREDAAPPHHRRRERARDGDDVFPPTGADWTDKREGGQLVLLRVPGA